MTETANIMVGTPAYNSMVHTDYVHSLLSFSAAGVSFSFLSIGGESLITRGRNSILAHFHNDQRFTHLLFLDGDVLLQGEDLKKMISHGRDVIGAPVALKTLEDGKPVFNIRGNRGQEAGLLKVERLGTAVMMLSRKAINALVNQAREQDRVYIPNQYARGIGDANEQYDVFQVGVRDGVYLSEDYWVCQQLIDLGYEVYVDLSVKTRHSGMASFGADQQPSDK